MRRRILDRAVAGDESSVPAVKKMLATSPEMSRQAGDLAHIVEVGWVRRLAGQNLVVREALAAELAKLKSALAGPAPTAIEQLLVERISACWVQVASMDASEAQVTERSLAQAELASKRQTHAHKRFLAAVKTLAEVRRLMRPSVQVNIAEQQVNVGG